MQSDLLFIASESSSVRAGVRFQMCPNVQQETWCFLSVFVGGGCCSHAEGPRLGLILPRSTERAQPPPALSGIRKVPAPWAHLRLPLIDSLIRNEQRRLVLWVIVIFVTPPEASCEREQLLWSNWTELSDGEQQQGSSERRWSISAPNDNEESLRETLGASQTCINCTLRTHTHVECIMLILVPICQPRFMAKAGL